MNDGLPTTAQEREELALYDYIFGYFPDALLAELQVSVVGNKQHNPGQKMHWARDKSTDHMNKATRHLFDYGRGIKKDTDGTYHLAKAIWRLKARLQLDIEAEQASRRLVDELEPELPKKAPYVCDSPDLPGKQIGYPTCGCFCGMCERARNRAGRPENDPEFGA